MNDSKIKVLEVPKQEQEQPPQATFPQTTCSLVPQGLIINVNLAPGLTLGQLIDAPSMDQIAKDWIKARTAQKQQELAIIRDIKKSRND